jgi:hypothetical protein
VCKTLSFSADAYLAESVHNAALRRCVEECHRAVHEPKQGLVVERLGSGQSGEVEQQACHHGCQALQQAQAAVHRQVQVPDKGQYYTI